MIGNQVDHCTKCFCIDGCCCQPKTKSDFSKGLFADWGSKEIELNRVLIGMTFYEEDEPIPERKSS